MKILEKLEQFFTPLILTFVLVFVVLTIAIFNEFIATRYIDLEYANSLISDGPLQTQRLLEMLEANFIFLASKGIFSNRLSTLLFPSGTFLGAYSMDSSFSYWLSYLCLSKTILLTSIGLCIDCSGFSFRTFGPFWVDSSVAPRYRPNSLFIVGTNCNLQTFCATADNRILFHRISNRG